MHILQITTFFKRRVAYIKGCYSSNMVPCLGRIAHYAFREMMYNCEGHILHANIYHVFCVKKKKKKKHIVKRALHVLEGSFLT